ncbi:MAG: hypothetical protein ACRDLP_03105, partial [Solirubrobacteraceae bacterium]
GGAGGPAFAVYPADSASRTQIATDTSLSVGSPGSGGLSGGPGAPARRAPSGSGAPCLGGCQFNAAIPVVLPAIGLVQGTVVVTQIECSLACHGTGTLRLLKPATKRPGGKTTKGAKATTPKPIGAFGFRTSGKGMATLRITLGPVARIQLAHKKSLLVQLTVVASVGAKNGTRTYISTLALTHRQPAPRNKVSLALRG